MQTMRLTSAPVVTMVIPVVAGLLAWSNAQLYSFEPEAADSFWDDRMPVLYAFNDTQLGRISASATSWWISSFITTEDGEQYLIVAHIMAGASGAFFRASTLNIDQKDHRSFEKLRKGIDISGRRLNISVDNNGIESLSDDNISKMRMYSNDDIFKFDIVFEATSRIVNNAGSGAFKFGDDTTYQWSIPSCTTHGSLDFKGEHVAIVPEKSMTWYDRQWFIKAEIPKFNWTWFELHVPERGCRLSIWVLDGPSYNQYSRFATIRDEMGSLNVAMVDWTPEYCRNYSSPVTGILYPLDWTLTIASFGIIHVTSILEDQEIPGKSVMGSVYEGFVAFKGNIHGEVQKGYGLVEMVTLT